MAKTEGKTYIQVRVGDKVETKVIKTTHNDDIAETDREIASQYEYEKEHKKEAG